MKNQQSEKIRILNHGETLSFKDLKQTNFIVSVVVPVDFCLLIAGDIEAINDKVSEIVTGSEIALNGISYEVYDHFYNKDTVALKISGFVSDIEELGEMADYEEVQLNF